MPLDPEVLEALKNVPPLNVDATPEDQDWIKKGAWDLPDTLEGLREHLERTGRTVAEFKRQPIYRWHLEDRPWLADL